MGGRVVSEFAGRCRRLVPSIKFTAGCKFDPWHRLERNSAESNGLETLFQRVWTRYTRGMRTLGVLAALVIAFAGCAGLKTRRARVFITNPHGGQRAVGTLVTKRLPSGAPRLFVAVPRSALESISGDTLLVSAPGLTTTPQALREGGWPAWRAHARRDAAMLPIRLYSRDDGRAISLESLEEGELKLPAPPAELMRLADEIPPR